MMSKLYKTFNIVIFFGVLFQFLKSDSVLSDRYHTYAEIDSILHQWDQEFGGENNPNSPYPNSGTIFKLIDLGVSTQDELPFWAVKLSFNADIDEDEPRVLILGQCHAEEILGVEISMDLIYRFLHPSEYPAEYQTLAGILYSSEVWIVPTYNPEGLEVVHGWQDDDDWIQDVSYRKNRMDANHNGIFDFDVNGYGNDIDGVDLNRNYGLNWIFGDQFLETDEGCSSNPSYVSNYDYYRGESPFSENEVSIIKNLLMDYDFTLSIAYHSSRSGCVAERVIYSWLWPGPKPAPDYQVIQPLGQEIAELTLKEVGDGNYHFAPSGSMRGNAHDWTYSQTGCIQYLIEVGTDNIQPDDVELIEDTIDRNLPGAFHLLKRAAGINYPTGPDKYQITGIVKDLNSGEPLEGVEVTINEMDGGILAPRLTDHFGRYRRLLYLNSFNIKFSKHGYEDAYYDNFIPSADIVSEFDIFMTPKSHYDVDINLSTPTTHSDSISLRITSDQYSNEHIVMEGSNTINLPAGDYQLLFNSQDILPVIKNIEVGEDAEIDVYLDWYDILVEEDFENLDDWNIVFGGWNLDNGKLLSQEDLVYSNFSPVGPSRINSLSGFYNQSNKTIIELDMKHELEWDNDTLFFDVYNSEDSIRIASFTNQNWSDSTYFYEINLDSNQNNNLSIGIISDITIGYRGLSLNQVKLMYDPVVDCVLGDLNHDSFLQVTDIVVLLNIILDNQSPTGFQNCSGDKTQDGNLDILDIISILVDILGE